MKRYRADIIAIVLLVLSVGIFFFRLFYPEPQIIVTPDFGRSDAWHFSFPTKYALWESLQDDNLPLWRADIGDGFPLFAEGQTGTLFLPNLILFRIFDPVMAYNFALMGSIIILALATYWLGRILTLAHVSSFFSAITVSFSGLAITNLTHISELQGMSLLPGIIALSLLIVRVGWRPWGILLSLAVSQQIFAGFPQSVFITLLAASAYVLWNTLPEKKFSAILTWGGFVALGIISASAQLLPSYEFLGEITDPQGFGQSGSTAYSMPIKHMLSLILPFVFGNPKYGTYPPFYAFDGSIFWENTAFVGIIAVSAAIGSMMVKKNTLLIRFLWIIVGCSLLLAFGKYSPTYIVYSIWPFNLFRVPSRFLWITIVSLSLLAGHTINTLRSQNLRILITLIHIGVLILPFWSYHLIEPASVWMQQPAIAKHIVGRTITIGETTRYNDIMTTVGWQDGTPYRQFKDGLAPDSNILWGVDQHHVYAGRKLHRTAIVNTLLADTIEIEDEVATISATKFLDMLSITDILSFYPVDAPNLIRSPIPTIGKTALERYHNPSALPRAYLVYEATTAATLEEAITTLRSDIFKPRNTVLVEAHDNVSWEPSPNSPHTITWKRDDHLAIELLVETQQEGLLVLTDTYYPGWLARIDKRETHIYAANLTQRMIKIPKGRHIITFTYEPRSFVMGMTISFISYTIIVFLMIVPWLFFAVRTRKKKLPHASDP